MLYLATTSASDGIDPWVWESATVCLVASAILAFVALELLVLGKAWVRRISFVSAFLSAFPFVLSAYVHQIDFVAVGGDGTPASGPLWKAVLIPGIPLLASMALICWRWFVPVERD